MTFVILRYGKLGDIVLTSVLLEALKKKEHIIYLSTKKIYKTLFKEDPRLKGMFFLEDSKPFPFISHIKKIKHITPDVVIDLEKKLRTHIISFSINKKTISYDSMRKERSNIIKRGGKSLLFVWERYLKTLDIIGIDYNKEAKPKLFIHPSDINKAKKILTDHKWIAVHTHAMHKQKELIKDNLISVVIYLKKNGFKTIHVGLKSTYDLPVDIDLRGKTDLGILKAILHLSDILITSDSGPLHISEAVGTPVLAIYGATSPLFGFAPWMEQSEILQSELQCSPCSLHGEKSCLRGDMKCLKDISSEKIIEKARKIIEASNISS